MNKLNSVAEIYTGYNFRSIANTRLQTVFIISAKDLDSNFTDLNEISIPGSYNNYLKEGDILVKSRGLKYEAKVFKPPKSGRKYIAASTLIVVRQRDRNYRPAYISQIINSDGAQQFLRSLSFGQTVPALAPTSLGLLNCPTISAEKQNQIEIIAEIIDDYRVTMTKYVNAQERLAKAVKTKLMKGVI